MKAEFEIRMTVGSMYRFLMYHAYHSFGGVFSIVAGLALILFYFLNRGSGTPNEWIYPAFGVLFLLYEPWTLYTRSVKQVKLNPVYRHPLHYALSGEGIAVWQAGDEDCGEPMSKEGQSAVGWADVRLVRGNRQCILVYTGKKNACIWIRRQLGDQETEVREILSKYVPADRLKLR